MGASASASPKAVQRRDGRFQIADGGTLTGVSVSAVNYVDGTQRGLSIGLFNYAETLHGVQLGLLNYAGNNPFVKDPIRPKEAPPADSAWPACSSAHRSPATSASVQP